MAFENERQSNAEQVREGKQPSPRPNPVKREPPATPQAPPKVLKESEGA